MMMMNQVSRRDGKHNTVIPFLFLIRILLMHRGRGSKGKKLYAAKLVVVKSLIAYCEPLPGPVVA